MWPLLSEQGEYIPILRFTGPTDKMRRTYNSVAKSRSRSSRPATIAAGVCAASTTYLKVGCRFVRARAVSVETYFSQANSSIPIGVRLSQTRKLLAARRQAGRRKHLISTCLTSMSRQGGSPGKKVRILVLKSTVFTNCYCNSLCCGWRVQGRPFEIHEPFMRTQLSAIYCVIQQTRYQDLRSSFLRNSRHPCW